MHVKRLNLKDFRNFENANIELSPNINVFYGDNAQGKTNLLEAIYFCAVGRSHRAGSDRELIRFGCREAHVQTIVARTDTLTERIDVHLKRDGKKGIAINNLPIKRFGELFGALIVVMFSPEDLQLIKAGPSERRRFIDLELCQLSGVYYYELKNYYHVLKNRNNLLKSILKKPELKETVFVWDEQLVSHGKKIMALREKFVAELDEISCAVHANITNGGETLKTSYRPNVTADEFEPRLKKNLDKDIALGVTSVGIHKDDVAFDINGFDVKVFGSQGQQRTASLSVKLAEIELVANRTGTVPVLLLDDVLSELDSNRRRFLFEHIKDVQTIITCTGAESFNIVSNLTQSSGAKSFRVVCGSVE